MTGSLFDPPEDAPQAAKRVGVKRMTREDMRLRTHAAARRDAPRTSHEAAWRIAPHVPAQAGQVLAHLAALGEDGATNEEMSLALGLRMSSTTARCRGLVLDGLVRDSGRTRPTSAGRNAVVWVVTHAGGALAAGRAEG